ncbi:MAG TPA: DUF4070 domain-containing protein, partial [Coleofasciculaceae cyanobacterium]
DGEKAGAGERIRAFVEEAGIPQPMLGILQAIPNTALWERLKTEQRLLEGFGGEELRDQNSLMNFQPTRPLAEIGREYIEALWTMYEPKNYLKRCLQQCLEITVNPQLEQNLYFPPGKGVRLVAQLIWHQGIQRPELRAQFWQQLWTIMRKKPQFLNMYLGLCAAGEHFWEYRVLARERIAQQLGSDPLSPRVSVEQREPVLVGR